MNVTSRFSWQWMVGGIFFLGGLTGVASAHSIAQIHKNPGAFDQQTVTVTGEVANVVTRYGDVSYTTFDLLNDKGVPLAVLVSQAPKCLQGDVCRVIGLFVAKKNTVLPEKVERLLESGYKDAGVLFRPVRGTSKKKGRTGSGNGGGPSGSGVVMPRGMYIPE
jgi:hypothetical protein